jgi:hypothetical protein
METFDNIFAAYYTLYRGESQTPDSTDDEYIIGMRYANDAVRRWANYDGMYWNQLWTTAQLDGGGTQTITTGTTTYLAPGNFKEAGVSIKIKNSLGNEVANYPIIQPNEVQFKGTQGSYAYFSLGQNYYSTGTVSQLAGTVTGSGTTFTADMVGMQIQYASGQVGTITAYTSATAITVSPSQTVTSTTYKIVNQGYSLILNPAPDASLNGLDIDYSYYKKPSLYTTGTSVSEIPDSDFVVHHMLSHRFKASRNWSAYQTANRDAENKLGQMKMDNDSGSYGNPWKVSDNSGTSWGE